MNKDRSKQFPKARQTQLIIKELPDEVLVYDLERDKAHCLNHSAALVWKNCDGKSSVSEIAASLGSATENAVDERLVWLALDQLEKFHLLDESPSMPAHLAAMNRRQLVRNLGAAALAIPVILTIAAPTPGQAATCDNPGTLCPSPGGNKCCSNNCAVPPGGIPGDPKRCQ